MFSVFNKLIINIIFSIYTTPTTLRLYILIIYTSPLNIWIIMTAISGLTGCHDYEAGPISLLTIKHICVTAFGLYRS